MKSISLISAIIFQLNSFAQCGTFAFDVIGAEPAYCRTSSIQSGNGVVYASATGGTPSYSYLWTDLQTGSTTTNTTWGGKNPGFYKIEVSDQIGCVLIDTLELDSINPVASFNIISSDLDGSFIGNAPVNFQVQNISSGVGWIGDPFSDDPIYWKLANFASYMPTSDVFQMVDGPTFTFESVQEICLAIENANGCVDTFCQYITVNGYAEVVEINEKFEVTTFPNPASNFVSIQSQKNIDRIEILDLTGRVVKVISCNGKTIETLSIEDLPIGSYFFKIQSANQIQVIQLVKE